MGGPTLDHITELKCPDGTYHKCLPYGECYDFQSYCSDKSRSVNSCFPDNILGNNESLLVWCREQISNNTTQRPHPACKLACVDKFGIAALYQCPPCQNETSADYTWATIAAVLAILLIGSVIGNVVFWVRQRKTPRRQNPTPVEPEAQDQLPRNNSKDSVNDETEGPAAPPARGAIETDHSLNQPALNERNVPLNIQFDNVQNSSTTNTQNRAPTNQIDPAQGGRTNTQNRPPMNQHDPAQGGSTNAQNGAPMNQHDPAQGGSTNTQSGAPMNQHDPAQGRSTNTQNGPPMNQHYPVQGGSTNTQNGPPMNQHYPVQGGSTDTQNGAPTILTSIDQSTINIQSGQARYYTQPRASVASARPRRDYDDTSAESLALIPRNHATESGDDISPIQTPTESGDDNSPVQTPTDLFIHTSTTISEVDGRHLVVTNFATYE